MPGPGVPGDGPSGRFGADRPGLRLVDVDHGYIHPCCTFTLSDLTIEVPGEYLG